ncbi:hypothetical protein D7Z54_33790 [Salibacterium salarium]|uniref:Uncharacterized protein n=1 Tax=Salibacterium salarium TaxID=284579 RepID=A0A3R9PX61_9BACI|nr:hypothetical protein [Salibacterium salarium]RSL28951.1 hypothetical protein D7Z54_33790 [Salibacterium salarium]
MSENNGGNGLLEMMTEEIAELNRRLRRVEAAQGYTEMGEMATGGLVPDRPKEYERAVLAAAERVPMDTPCEWVPDKSPQQRRDEAVERAKADIDEILSNNYRFDDTPKINTANKSVYFGYPGPLDKCEFIVNREKRTVVALIKTVIEGDIVHRGIAKCAPTDCFNVHIGRAIALRRALGLDVPAEYVKAPQPTEVRVGDVVRFRERSGSIRTGTVEIGWNEEPERGKLHASSRVAERSVIIDDSRESEAK